MQPPTDISTPSDDAELISLLETLADAAPRELIDEAAARGDEMEAKLIAIIKNEESWYVDPDESNYWMPLHAVMTLGLRETEAAGIALADALRLCTESGSDLGDWFAGFWPALTRNKPDSIAKTFQTLFRKRADNEYCRIVSADVLTAIAQRQGPAALNKMLSQIAGVVADQSETLVFRQYMATLLLDFPRAEYRELIKSLADVKSDLGVMYGKSDVESAFNEMTDAPEWEEFNDPWYFYSEEAIAQRADQDFLSDDNDDVDDESDEKFVETVVYESPKVGRNDPCPCGSGKKYKKCCLLRDAE
jgi:hypothetical protein